MKWTRVIPTVAVLGLAFWFLRSMSAQYLAPESLSTSGESLELDDPSGSGEELAIAAPVRAGEAQRESLEAQEPPPADPGQFEDPEEEFEWVEAHEDVIEQGACGLFLQAVWGESLNGEPVATHFRLYRLDAPENEFYEAGDQAQFEGELPVAGRQLRLLPEGRYRVACWVGAKGSQDPPAFTVSGEQTKVSLHLLRPASATAYLQLFDENGLSVTQVDRRRIVNESSASGVPPLDWVNWRAPKVGYYVMSEGNLDFSSDFGPPVEHLDAGAEGFALGRVRAPGKVESHRSLHHLGLPGYTDIEVPLAWDGQGQATWVAVIAPLERITDSLWFEYGDRPDLDLLELTATCTARRTRGLPKLEPWAPLGIEVVANYPGYETMSFRWIPGDGPLVDHFMRETE